MKKAHLQTSQVVNEAPKTDPMTDGWLAIAAHRAVPNCGRYQQCDSTDQYIPIDGSGMTRAINRSSDWTAGSVGVEIEQAAVGGDARPFVVVGSADLRPELNAGSLGLLRRPGRDIKVEMPKPPGRFELKKSINPSDEMLGMASL